VQLARLGHFQCIGLAAGFAVLAASGDGYVGTAPTRTAPAGVGGGNAIAGDVAEVGKAAVAGQGQLLVAAGIPEKDVMPVVAGETFVDRRLDFAVAVAAVVQAAAGHAGQTAAAAAAAAGCSLSDAPVASPEQTLADAENVEPSVVAETCHR